MNGGDSGDSTDETRDSEEEVGAPIATARDSVESAADRAGVDEGTDAGGAAVDAVSGAADAASGVADLASDTADSASAVVDSSSDIVSGAADLAEGATDAPGEAVDDDTAEALDRASDTAGTVGDTASATGSVSQLTDRLSSAGGGRVSSAIDSGRRAVDTVSGPVDRFSDALSGGAGESQNVTLRFECDEVEDQWLVMTANLDEGLNRPYSATIRLYDNSGEGEPIQLLGKNCVLIIERGSLMRRMLGIISQVHEDSTEENQVSTTIMVEPAFALMQHRINTKIFQEQTVTEILKEVLDEGLGAYNRSFDNRTARGMPTCEYRTQFDESDFAFCQRLMEEEGIIYWFEHEGETEVLVLADADNEYGTVECLHGDTIQHSDYSNSEGGREQIGAFSAVSQLAPTKVVTRHYDWTHSPVMIENESQDEGGGEDEETPNGATLAPDREHYEHDWEPLTLHQYSGTSYGADDSDDQVRLRREQQAYDARTAQGHSTVIDMAPGKVFEMTGHPRGLDGRYLLVSVSHSFSGNSGSNTFHCIPANVPFRARRVTPKPRVPGIQTAKVVGPSGEEIHTDEHGRVKVQFHWDRHGANDDHSSCWMRVMQPWAGAGWGFVFIPRIDMEVVVTFVNGDPDRPLVTGSMYNDANIPPHALPDNKTKSTIYTNSSLGGDGYNELTFEDAAGEEQIITHAQKDYNETVENNHSTTVHGNQTNGVDGNHSETVGGEQTLSVSKTREVNVTQDHTETIGGHQTVNVSGDQETNVTLDRRVNVSGAQMVGVDGGYSSHEVDGHHLLRTTGNVTIEAAGSITIQSGTATTVVSIDGNALEITAGGGASLRLDDKVVLRSAGGARLRMTENAAIHSNDNSLLRLYNHVDLLASTGAKLKLTADAAVESEGGSKLKLDGDAHLEGGSGGTVKLDGNATIEGTEVKLNQ